MVVVQGADVKRHFAQSTQEGQSARESRTGPTQWRQRGARGGRGVDSDGLENLDLADGGDREPLLFIVHLDFLERVDLIVCLSSNLKHLTESPTAQLLNDFKVLNAHILLLYCRCVPIKNMINKN